MEHSLRDKWTAGVELDKVWVEYLIKMMSSAGHKVKLDNRAMAGSWTLCAPAKIESMDAFKDTAINNFAQGAMLLFQGSLIPPCEGLIVKSYLEQKRNEFYKLNQRYPDSKESFISDKTLVVFFNSANDFLNKWADPGGVAREYINDIWSVLAAGAHRVVVVTLPDVSETPRFKGTPEAKVVSKLVKEYNTQLSMRLNNLRWEFDGDNRFQVITVHGDRMFAELLADSHWDVKEPLLDVDIPGIDHKDQQKEEAERNKDFVTAQLLENRTFDDHWRVANRTADSVANKRVAPDKTAFFADSVHPSAEAHYAIAVKACERLDSFNIPCDPKVYSFEQAKKDSRQNNPDLGKKDEL